MGKFFKLFRKKAGLNKPNHDLKHKQVIEGNRSKGKTLAAIRKAEEEKAKK
jgi:hypothetical protein